MTHTPKIALLVLMLAACTDAAENVQVSDGGGGKGGSGGVLGWPIHLAGEGGMSGEEAAGAAGEGPAGAAGAAGSSEGGAAGDTGEAGAGGEVAIVEPDDCELPTYLQAAHLMESGLGKPDVLDIIPSTNIGTVPFGTIVRYGNKYNDWRCDHHPFCNYAVLTPSLVLLPRTERYWTPVFWQGNPPNGAVGEWVSPCEFEPWEQHNTCGGFYLDGDLTVYKDPSDLYAERFVWSCRDGWSEVCDTQAPGTGNAWANISTAFQCYGF